MDMDFDASLVTAAFDLGATAGWAKVTAASAARHAGLDLPQARTDFTTRSDILVKFGELADRFALSGALAEGAVRDRLFDILLRRFDFLQTHRAGVVALLKILPVEPALALCLARGTLNSMGWMLEGAGESSTGIMGELRKRGLGVVWAYGMRAWLRDESPDLTATMAAVDTALERADSIAARFVPRPPSVPADENFAVPTDPELPFPEDPSAVA
jgi:hypothetical protein